MASTAQVCLPYSGVEKERRCGVALSGLSLGATANAWTTRETLRRAFLKFGANLLRTFDPIERCRADQRFFRKKPSRLCSRTANDAGRSLAWQNGGLASAIAPKLPRSIICLAARRPTISLLRDSGPWRAFFPGPRQTARSVLGLWLAQRGARRLAQVTSQSTRSARIGRAPHWRS
jgi:hypothetical protein